MSTNNVLIVIYFLIYIIIHILIPIHVQIRTLLGDFFALGYITTVLFIHGSFVYDIIISFRLVNELDNRRSNYNSDWNPHL